MFHQNAKKFQADWAIAKLLQFGLPPMATSQIGGLIPSPPRCLGGVQMHIGTADFPTLPLEILESF
jgi:hypothetical protein